ncbi:MAG: imidazole glycerol phosphate synthase subunit HisH [Patescibacteria group bacterium]
MIAVVDYGLGNLASVARALRAVGHPAEITGEAKTLARADRLVLPGVGAFGACMANLSARGLVEPILAHINAGRPYLGICLGLQILMEQSEEDAEGGAPPRGLGVFRGVARRLPGPGKVPQIGWNSLSIKKPYPYLAIRDGDYVYFVHSYYADPLDRSLILAEADYGLAFAAALGRDNILAVQFHPEKSGAVGLRLLKAFCEGKP